jgi:hypothetical protein
MDIVLINTKMSGESTSIIDSTFCSNKTILCLGNNDVDHISEGVLNSLEGQDKINLDPILYRSSEETSFLLDFQVISNIF